MYIPVIDCPFCGNTDLPLSLTDYDIEPQQEDNVVVSCPICGILLPSSTVIKKETVLLGMHKIKNKKRKLLSKILHLLHKIGG